MGKNMNSGRKNHPSPAQLANLRKTSDMTPEELRAFQAKGKAAQQASAAKRRMFKEAAEKILSLPAFKSDNELLEYLKKEYPGMNNAEAMTMAVVLRTMSDGDAKAFSTIRDTIGEIPSQLVSIGSNEPMTITIKTVE